MNDFFWYSILVLAGLIAGIVNTIAGGGSFLTLPALMLFGLDPKIANGTNRVAVLLSSAAATATFHKHGYLDQPLARRLAIPTLCGVPLGALLAVYLPNAAFEGTFGTLFLVMAAVMASNPKRLMESRPTSMKRKRSISLTFFLIGIYVGFIQAGMGILVLLAMSLLVGTDLLAANAVKNSIAFIVTLVATIMFAYHGLVDWVPGLVMAGGNVAGGVIGAKLAIKKGNRLVFWFLIVVMIATGIKLVLSGLNASLG